MKIADGARHRIAIHRMKGCYFARALDIPGCVARGSTEVEAVENARRTIRAYVFLERLLATRKATVELEITA